MKLEVAHHGSAVILDGEARRLKDVLPLETLELGGLRVAAAEAMDDGWLQLTTTRGERLRAPDPRADDRRTTRRLLIRNIGQLLTMQPNDDDPLGLQRDVQLLCADGEIERVLPAGEEVEVDERTTVIDARGRLVTPGLVDPHTHPVFAGERSLEFGLKAAGASYLEIHKAGGGLFNTVEATRAASFEELEERCRQNLGRLLSHGVTTIEGKSGYALEAEGELRMLEVLRAVDGAHPVDVVPTLLGAHALPKELAERREEYVAQVSEVMVPRAAAQGLARYCDAYCEDGAFTAAEVETIFTAAKAAGLGLRLHAEQFTHQGGAELAARMGAASADHLEAVSEAAIDAMAAAQTTAVLLPGAALTCRAPWPPAQALLEAGVPLALGTDLNPGSSMTANLPLQMSLACMQMGVSCEQAWRAVTVEAARCLGLDVGVIAPGRQADLVLFDVDDYRTVPYHYGENHARAVIKRGELALDRG